MTALRCSGPVDKLLDRLFGGHSPGDDSRHYSEYAVETNVA